jgi:hypothetical protein
MLFPVADLPQISQSRRIDLSLRHYCQSQYRRRPTVCLIQPQLQCSNSQRSRWLGLNPSVPLERLTCLATPFVITRTPDAFITVASNCCRIARTFALLTCSFSRGRATDTAVQHLSRHSLVPSLSASPRGADDRAAMQRGRAGISRHFDQ